MNKEQDRGKSDRRAADAPANAGDAPTLAAGDSHEAPTLAAGEAVTRPWTRGPDTENVTEVLAEGATPISRIGFFPRIPGYTILREIASGGMGTVYQAEQLNPHRRVALKVVKSGMAAPEVLRRFQYEAQVLALLQHEGIARIYEAGTFDAGAGPQPFFAMEFVEGETLTSGRSFTATSSRRTSSWTGAVSRRSSISVWRARPTPTCSSRA